MITDTTNRSVILYIKPFMKPYTRLITKTNVIPTMTKNVILCMTPFIPQSMTPSVIPLTYPSANTITIPFTKRSANMAMKKR